MMRKGRCAVDEAVRVADRKSGAGGDGERHQESAGLAEAWIEWRGPDARSACLTCVWTWRTQDGLHTGTWMVA